MNVPAWPMPIHQTKFTIANPHATGILTPQTPTPFSNSQRIAKFSNRKMRMVLSGCRICSSLTNEDIQLKGGTRRQCDGTKGRKEGRKQSKSSWELIRT